MSSAPFSLRRLGPPDLALARALNAMFGAAFEDRETYEDAPPSDAYLEALLGREDVVVLAALADGAVLGGLVAYAFDKLERMRREVYLYDLAVAAAHRRRGIATALIAHLRGIAASQGAYVVMVQADPGDDAAIALYEGLGTREAVLHYDIAVEDAAARPA